MYLGSVEAAREGIWSHKDEGIGNKSWQQVIVCAGYSGELPEVCLCSCIGDKWAQKR